MSSSPSGFPGGSTGAAGAAADNTAKILEYMEAPSTNKVVALDCEMVECMNARGEKHPALAQVSIVGFDGKEVFQTLVLPPLGATISNYRTPYSGLSKNSHFEEAQSFAEVQGRVRRILAGKVVVGHALLNDFRSLGLLRGKFPEVLKVIDTSTMPCFQIKHVDQEGAHPPRLKDLAWACLGRKIQTKVHNPTEDAVTALDVVKYVAVVGEKAAGEKLVGMKGILDAALKGRNVPEAAKYETIFKLRKVATDEHRQTRILVKTLESEYEEAIKSKKPNEIIKQRKAALDEANRQREKARDRAEETRGPWEEAKRIVDGARRAAQNAVVIEGRNLNEVLPLAPSVAGGTTTATATAGAGAGPGKRTRKSRRPGSRIERKSRRN